MSDEVIPRELEVLANYLGIYKERTVLFLGAGTSLESGGPTTDAIVRDTVEKYWHAETDLALSLYEQFYRVMGRHSDEGRYRILEPYFRNMEPSLGYQKLGAIVRAGYFRVILTTNFDPMIEASFRLAGLKENDEYHVHIAGIEKEGEIEKAFSNETLIRVLKLHGDLRCRKFAFTPLETSHFPPEVERVVSTYSERMMVFVGYRGKDVNVLRSIKATGEPIWWINPKRPVDEAVYRAFIAEYAPEEEKALCDINTDVYRVLYNRHSDENMVYGSMARFDTFFPMLHTLLLGTS